MSTRKGRYGNPRNRKTVGDLYTRRQPSGVADPRRLGGSIAGPGGPHDRDAVIVDTTDCVLLDYVEVTAIMPVRGGEPGDPAVFMALDGRVNKSTDRVRVGYLFDADGAAAIITELLALADRGDFDLFTDVARRLITLGREHNVDLARLWAAVETAIAVERAMTDEE